jgi:hypothetical protein
MAGLSSASQPALLTKKRTIDVLQKPDKWRSYRKSADRRWSAEARRMPAQARRHSRRAILPYPA